MVQLGGRGGLGRVHHRAHAVLGDEPRQVGGGTERPPVHLGKAESGVLGGDDDVGVADQPDAAAQTEALHGGDDRHLAVVDGGERRRAAPVHPHQRLVPLGLDLLDVHPGAETAALGAQHHDPVRRVAGRRRATASASANHPATSRAFTGGTSMTTSAVPGSRS